jgi:D-sedoheptulose 7-phosphate isomerase
MMMKYIFLVRKYRERILHAPKIFYWIKEKIFQLSVSNNYFSSKNLNFESEYSNAMKIIQSHFREAADLLQAFMEDEENFKAIEKAGKIMVESIKGSGKIISCGNGGSMSDAMHFAEELLGRFRENRAPVAAIAISDPAYLSCTANDYGYDLVFSRFIEGMAQKEDVLLAISTSGNSPNVIKAMESARKKGMKIVGLSGKTGGKMPALCDVEIRAPFSPYSDRVQEIHIKIIHSLIDYIERNI